MGLGAVDLVAANPKLIYCNLRAFGATGPLTDKPGYDPLMQAFGGLMSVTGEEGRPAVRVGTSLIDMGTGMWCVIGILSALPGKAPVPAVFWTRRFTRPRCLDEHAHSVGASERRPNVAVLAWQVSRLTKPIVARTNWL